jgi:hypothetical protein
MSKKNLFRFNVKNVKYAVKDAGSYGVVTDLAYAKSLSLEPDFDTLNLYGDGQKLGQIIDDKGKTGTLSVIDINEEYEIALKRQMLLDGGNRADIQQIDSISHALYYETDIIEDGVRKTVKVWMLNCVTAPAAENYEQTEDNPSINGFDYPLTVFGEKLMANGGLTEYKDSNGNTINTTRVFAYPDDTNYATFEDDVPTPEAPIVV